MVASIREQSLDIAAGELNWRNEAPLWKLGTMLIGLVVALIHAVAGAFRFTFFFTAASAIYLLLRQDVDEKEMDEVFIDAPVGHTPALAVPGASGVGETPR